MHYVPRLASHDPNKAPVAVGDWIYHPFAHHNVRVIRVYWESDLRTWRVQIPGYTSGRDGIPAFDPAVRNVEYVETSPSTWAPAK